MSAAFAIDLTDAETYPSRRTEAWKYSDLKRWLREAPEPSGTALVSAPGPFYDLGGEAIVFANGRPVGVTDFIASGVQTPQQQEVLSSFLLLLKSPMIFAS